MNQRLRSLDASMKAFSSEETPTSRQTNDLLVSALQAHATLMRMSRVFPAARACKRVDVGSALGHAPTRALAGQLRCCWTALGVTDSTLKAMLHLLLAGALQRIQELSLPASGHPDARDAEAIEPDARQRLADEGSGQ